MGTLSFRIVSDPSEPFSPEAMIPWPTSTPEPTNETDPPSAPAIPYDDQLRDEQLS